MGRLVGALNTAKRYKFSYPPGIGMNITERDSARLYVSKVLKREMSALIYEYTNAGSIQLTDKEVTAIGLKLGSQLILTEAK